MNNDQVVRFVEGSDSGENDPTSTQPIGGSETYHADVLNRAPENLRMRTEVLRMVSEILNYEADYDRSLTLSSTGTFAIQQVSAGLYSVIATQDLWIHPTLTPGGTSGGRAYGAVLFNGGVPYLGTLGVNDISVVADSRHTGQRGYADGQMTSDVADTASVGADDISVSFVANAVAGGPGSIVVTITGTPVRHVQISWGTTGGGTTVSQLITAINADRTSQGSFGAADYIYLSTTSPGTSTSIPTTTPIILQGGYDAEAHRITPAQLADFFSTAANQLQDKEALAIGFPIGAVETGSPPGAGKGGRRQSLYDLPINRVGGTSNNTTPAVGNNLFNTGREPEKIPLSIPIGKVVNGFFVFIDGTTIPLPSAITTGPYSALSESAVTLARLLSSTPVTGATLIGYGETASWNDDSGDTISSVTVQGALDEIMTDLAGEAIGNSGARRIGIEITTGTASAGNLAKSTVAGSIREQIVDLLNASGSTGAAGGINAKVNEFGHALHGKQPLSKDFRETAPEDLTGGGGTFLRSITTAPVDSIYPITAGDANPRQTVELQLKPFVTDLSRGGGSGVLHASESVAAPNVPGAGRLSVSSLTNSTFTNVFAKYPHNTIFAAIFGLGVVQLTVSGVSTYYLISAFDFTNHDIVLVNLDGSAPTLVFASTTISFFTGKVIGETPVGSSSYELFLSQQSIKELIGTGQEANGYPSAAVLRTVERAANTPGNAALVTQLETVDEEHWYEYSAGDALLATRDTHNILITADASLLKGNELGNIVDATSSHDHGATYSRYLPIQPFLITWTGSASLSVEIGNLPDYPLAGYLGSYIPYRNSGIHASIVAGAAGGYMRVTGLTGMNSSSAGRYLYIQGASSAANNGMFLISGVNSSTSVDVVNAAAVIPDTNNPNLIWNELLYIPVAVDLAIDCHLFTLTATSVQSQIWLFIAASAGNPYSDGNRQEFATFTGYKALATSFADQYLLRGRKAIACDGAGNFTVNLQSAAPPSPWNANSNTGFDTTNTLVAARVVGVYMVRA